MPVPVVTDWQITNVQNWTAPIVVPTPTVGTGADTLLIAFGALHNLNGGNAPGGEITESRIDAPAGWNFLGGTRRYSFLDIFCTFAWYKKINAANLGSEPVSHSFVVNTYTASGEIDRLPIPVPTPPAFGAVVAIVKYEQIDIADPIHNISFVSGKGDVLETSATTHPPVIGIPEARLSKFTAVDKMVNFVPPAEMTERWDVNNGVNFFDQAVSSAYADEPVIGGIVNPRTTSWGTAAHWSDLFVVIRPSGPPDLPANWTFSNYSFVDTFSITALEPRMVASKYDNFMYWFTAVGNGTTTTRGHKMNRTTGAIVLQVDLAFQLWAPIAMDVSADAIYVFGADFKLRKFSLNFDLITTSAELDDYFIDLVVGSGASAGQLWAMIAFDTVGRYSTTTLAQIDEVPIGSWPASSDILSGTLDSAGNLWALCEVDSSTVFVGLILASNLSLSLFDVSAGFPGTGSSIITYDAEQNALYIANDRLFGGEITTPGHLVKYDITLDEVTETFTSDKRLGPMRSGFKFGPRQCCLPICMTSRSAVDEFCLPLEESNTEVLLLSTLDLSLIRRYPTDTITSDRMMVDSIFDPSQSPDYIWAQFIDIAVFNAYAGRTYRVGYLSTGETIFAPGCADIPPPPSPIIPIPTPVPGQGFCTPISIPFRAVHRKILPWQGPR